jgi:hypothetical protein
MDDVHEKCGGFLVPLIFIDTYGSYSKYNRYNKCGTYKNQRSK